MRRKLFRFPFLALVAAPLLVLACAADEAAPVSGEQDLLPNGGVFERDHDGSGYRVIAEDFGKRGFDLNVDLTKLDTAWPMRGPSTAVLNRVGTPIFFGTMAYYHTALDVMRTVETDDDTVLAPVTGRAFTYDWSGNPRATSRAYSSVVAIWDEASHVVVQLMHVAPTSALAQATEPVQVTKGEPIGKLARPGLGQGSNERLAHTHVSFVDGAGKKSLDTAALLASYRDTTKPAARRIYVTDAQAKVSDGLVSGAIDVVLEAFDRDEDSQRNLELAAIAFEIQDQTGKVLAKQPRCNLIDLHASVAQDYSFRAAQLLDFGTARAQMSGGWPNSDIDNPDRTFRYALTQLKVQDGKCTVVDDTQGFLQVDDSVTALRVATTFWDPKGNTASFTRTLVRGGDGGAPVGPPPKPVRDAGTALPDGG